MCRKASSFGWEGGECIGLVHGCTGAIAVIVVKIVAAVEAAVAGGGCDCAHGCRLRLWLRLLLWVDKPCVSFIRNKGHQCKHLAIQAAYKSKFNSIAHPGKCFTLNRGSQRKSGRATCRRYLLQTQFDHSNLLQYPTQMVAQAHSQYQVHELPAAPQEIACRILKLMRQQHESNSNY